MIDNLIPGITLGALILALLIAWIVNLLRIRRAMRRQDKQTQDDYEASPQMKARRDRFIEEIKKRNEDEK
jgi:type III secretory pathway component EscU